MNCIKVDVILYRHTTKSRVVTQWMVPEDINRAEWEEFAFQQMFNYPGFQITWALFPQAE